MNYLPEIVIPDNPDDKYKVDLVHISDDEQEQRLTLAQYTSWAEAEEHLSDLQTAIERDGVDAIADDIRRLKEKNRNPFPYAFGEHHQPINRDSVPVPHHIDSDGTVHWFDRVESQTPEQSPYELRYFRAQEMESGKIKHDSYPIMPLDEDDPNLAWPLHGLDMYLKRGDVLMAQQFASDVADAYDQPFPDPLTLPALNPEPEYYFGYGVGPSNLPSLEAVKTWMQGTERQFDTVTIGEYGTFEEASVHERELEALMDEKGLEVAMNLAETMSVAGGYLDADRDDVRLFFEEDVPADPFTTNRQRELAGPEYTVGAISANGASFLDVMKTWGKDEYERLVIPQPDWDTARDLYEAVDDLLQTGDLQDAMRVIETEGIQASVIDPEREDGRLFTIGPDDPFTTIRQEQLTSPELETEEMPAIHQSVENPYWRLETVPVNDPEGEPLGHALHILVYDDIEHNPEAIGAPPMDEDEPFRMLEMAHFETTEAADRFGKEFNSYLMPGLLEGPELAIEVARLEELPLDWKTLEEDDLKPYRDGKYTLTREPSDWHPYNPKAERDTRIEAEGLYTAPIRQFVKLDEGEDEPKLKPVSPDFDL